MYMPTLHGIMIKDRGVTNPAAGSHTISVNKHPLLMNDGPKSEHFEELCTLLDIE
jgi:hypothetical protein